MTEFRSSPDLDPVVYIRGYAFTDILATFTVWGILNMFTKGHGVLLIVLNTVFCLVVVLRAVSTVRETLPPKFLLHAFNWIVWGYVLKPRNDLNPVPLKTR